MSEKNNSGWRNWVKNELAKKGKEEIHPTHAAYLELCLKTDSEPK